MNIYGIFVDTGHDIAAYHNIILIPDVFYAFRF